MPKLEQDRVEEIFEDCLFAAGEDTTNCVEAEGIQHTVGFHPGRLEQHTPEIAALLDELSDDFKQSVGGGASFLGACYDKHGNLWTGLHGCMDQLFMLGMATGMVTCPVSRQNWHKLPEGMPYYVITELPQGEQHAS